MPEWTDKGLILSIRPHGERNAVVSLLTLDNGRHAGLVHAYDASSRRGTVQIGNLVQADWRARLADQLGTFQLELLKIRLLCFWIIRSSWQGCHLAVPFWMWGFLNERQICLSGRPPPP